ncbi:MAG: HNH endonuclease signature motif containing protein [Truepera sp.]|nr:HNH endonuclease signature motif containing protein [Truepera sp.]
MPEPGSVISTILKHDNKQTSYKIALLRSINDVVLSYPDLRNSNRDVAIPLRALAEFWIAYYWPFMSAEKPILQGAQAFRDGRLRNDVAFRPELTRLKTEWEALVGSSRPADGFVITSEMRVSRTRDSYPKPLLKAYRAAARKIATRLRQPIQYAGPGSWGVFDRPRPYQELPSDVIAVPGTRERDVCLVAKAELWRTFQEVSLWVEALCIHEWSLFTETVVQAGARATGRGETYALLTDRPDNRRPLSWERNEIDLLMMEGRSFTCPWTGKQIKPGGYHIDHLVAISIYPTNELWNLVPADPHFNLHVKRARLPGQTALASARPHLIETYRSYQESSALAEALGQDVRVRFGSLQHHLTSERITDAVIDLLQMVAASRNLATF